MAERERTAGESRLRHKRQQGALLGAAIVSVAGVAQAGVLYWDGTANPGNYGTASNWSTSSTAATPNPASAPGAGDDAIFSISTITNTAQTINLATTPAANSLQFKGTNAGATTLQAASAIGLTVVSGIVVESGAGAVTLGGSGAGSVTMKLGGNQSWQNDSATTLTIVNTVQQATTGVGNQLTLSGSGTGGFTFNGQINGTATSGTSLVINTAGTVLFNSSNTYDAGTTLTAGTLKFGVIGANLGALAGSLTVNGGTLDINAPSARSLSIGNLSGTGGTILNNGSALATVTIGALNTGGGTFAGTISDNSNAGTGQIAITKTGTGTITISGSNSYTGNTTLNGGTLGIGSNAPFGSVGSIIVSSGTLQANSAAPRTLVNSIDLTGTTLTIGSGGNLTFGALKLNGGNRTAIINNGATTVSSIGTDATTSRTLTKQGTGALLVTGNTTYTSTTDLQAGMLGVAGTFNTSGLLKLDGGVIGLNTTYTRNLGAGSGQVQFVSGTSGGFAGFGSNSTFGNSANNLAVKLNNNNTPLVWGSTANFLSNGQSLILGNANATGTVDFQNYIDLNSAARTIQVDRSTAAGATDVDAVLSGVISNGSLTKTGAGVLRLAGSNTYAGATSILSGSVSITGKIASNGRDKVAIATDTNGDYSFDGPSLSRSMVGLGSNSYAGIGSTGVGGLNTYAQLRAGTNSINGGPDTDTVTMTWRSPTLAETPGSSTRPPILQGQSTGLISNVISLSGMGEGGAAGNGKVATDTYVLEMSYTTSLTGSDEQTAATAGELYLAWLDPGAAAPTATANGLDTWKNAVIGNSNFTAIGAPVLATYDGYLAGTTGSHGLKSAGAFVLGDWGVDISDFTTTLPDGTSVTYGGRVWAVIDHNSSFAVVPEPATLSVLGLAGILLAGRRRRRVSIPRSSDRFN